MSARTDSAIEATPNADMRAFQSGLPVRLIATPRADLMICAEDEPLACVIERNRDTKFDYVPVIGRGVDDDGQIVGLLELAAFQDGTAPSITSAEHMNALSERYLVGADASIIEFIRHADERPCRLTVSGETISGLVCLYDMQKLPARAALFAMITQLEISMAESIARLYGDPGVWLKRLTAERREKIDHEIRDARQQDAFVNPLLYTQFGDKVTILRKHGCIEQKNRLRGDMEAIQRLRDSLAHANDYAGTREECRTVSKTVRSMDFWMVALAEVQAKVVATGERGSADGK
jgi:hypothetical protein